MKKIFTLLCIGIIVCFTLSCGGKNDMKNENTYEQITQEEAKKIMDEQEGYVIVDARTQEEFETGHIPNAICIPNETISENVVEQLPNKDQLILIYCRSGNRSKKAADKLVQLGYTNIKEFGGIITWPYEIEK